VINSIREDKVSLHLTKWLYGWNIDQEVYSNEKTVANVIRRWKHDNGLALNAPLREIVLSGNANGYSGNGNNGQIIGNVNFVSNWYSDYTPP